MTVITFAHVKKFFENADRDEFGYYNLGPVFLNSKIHIYSPSIISNYTINIYILKVKT